MTPPDGQGLVWRGAWGLLTRRVVAHSRNTDQRHDAEGYLSPVGGDAQDEDPTQEADGRHTDLRDGDVLGVDPHQRSEGQHADSIQDADRHHLSELVRGRHVFSLERGGVVHADDHDRDHDQRDVGPGFGEPELLAENRPAAEGQGGDEDQEKELQGRLRACEVSEADD